MWVYQAMAFLKLCEFIFHFIRTASYSLCDCTALNFSRTVGTQLKGIANICKCLEPLVNMCILQQRQLLYKWLFTLWSSWPSPSSPISTTPPSSSQSWSHDHHHNHGVDIDDNDVDAEQEGLWQRWSRQRICQKICTTGFSGQKFYTLKMRKLWLYLLKNKLCKCIDFS